MPEPLLPSKVIIAAPNPLFSPRPEVLAKLNEGLQGRLTTLISGPGYGKTMHVAWFVRQVSTPVAWLQVDEYDGEAVRFLTYLRQAVFPARRDPDPLSRPPSPEAVMAEIATVARDRGSLILVLDDLHAAPGPFAARFVVQLARAAPPQLHLFVTARPSLTLPLGRMRLTHGVTEIRQLELTLSDAEASALLLQSAGHSLPPSQVKRATALVAGWGAGLILLGAALGRNAALNLADQRIPEDLSRYLLEETWTALSPGEQRLLESACLVRHMTADLAAGLFGDGVWGEVLDRLYHGYGILTAVAEGEYGIHPLWSKFLRDRMAAQVGPGGMQARSREAAAVLAAQGRFFGAVQLYLDARDYQQAAALIAQMVPVWNRSISHSALSETLDHVPMHVLQELPWLALWVAQTAYVRGRLDEARLHAEVAAAGFVRDQERTGQAVVAALRCTLALMGDDTLSARRFLEEGLAAVIPGMELLRAQLLEQRWQLLLTEQPGDWDGQERLLQEALLLYQRAPSPQTEHEARVLDRLGHIATQRGHFDFAIELLERAVELLTRIGTPPWESGFNLGYALSAACRFAEAQALFVPMCQQSEWPMRRLVATLNLLDIYITLDDPVRAQAAARTALELTALLKTLHLAVRGRVEMARLYRLQGEYDLAVEEARTAIAQAVQSVGRQSEGEARRALSEAALWSQAGSADAPEHKNLAPGTPEGARTAALAGVYLLRSRTRAVRAEGTALMRQALRDLSQQSSFRSFVLRHWDLALTFAVAGLAVSVLPFVCLEILSTLEEVPESVRTRGIRLPDPEARYVREAAAALDGRGVALLERLIHPDQRLQVQQAAVPLLQVSLLDRFSLRLNGELLEGKELRWRRTRALLLTLLLMPEGVEREMLADWLWPDARRRAGQNNLRVSLHNLRRPLEPDRPPEEPSAFVGSTASKLIWIAETTRVDAWEAQHHLHTATRALKRGDPAAAAQAYEQAVSLYRGPLVTDGCSWLEGIRTDLHRQMVAALFWLAKYYREGQPERGIEHLRRLLELEPGEEQGVRELMILLAGAGRQAEAAQVYRRCCDYLERELGVPVSPSTTAVYQEAVGVSGVSARHP